MLRRYGFGGLAVCVLLLALGAISSRSLPDERAQKPFIIVLNDWASQHVFAHVVGQLLEGQGQPVAFQVADSVLQFDALARGDAHFQVTVWHNRMAADLERALDQGVIDAGHHALHFRDGWWVSDATLSVCPEAALWSGLVACAQRLAGTAAPEVIDGLVGDASESMAWVGQFAAPPVSFNRDYTDLIARLRMPFEHAPVADLEALRAVWQQLDSETERVEGAPIRAVYNWSPNTDAGPVNGQFVAFPAPELACFRDADWGPNPDVTGDCGDPLPFPISKAAWAGVMDAFPEAWQLVQAVSFDAIDYRQITTWMARPGSDAQQVAKLWIDANADRVAQWQNAL